MENNKSVQEYDIPIGHNLDAEDYFKGILKACYEKKLLDSEDLRRISCERLETLKVQLKYYTKDESSSVMVETAEYIMQGIDYTIGIYLKTLSNTESIIKKLKNTNLAQMMRIGNDQIKGKILRSKKLFANIQKNKLQIDNYSYNDTIDGGISLFFKEYKEFFGAHESPGSIDYQLCIDNMNYKGIEYINNYLETLSIENEFCNNFDICEINELLKGYDKKCELLLINVFELVLINSIGRMICGKNLNSLNINNTDREYIKSELVKLSLEELQEVLVKYGKRCCEVLEIKNGDLVNYIRNAVIKITPSLYESIKINKLEKIFISFNENGDDETIKYLDGKKLSNSAFRKLTEKIRECSLVQDKVLLIRNNIKSLEDLTDMLNAECLFEDEYTIFFKNLSQLEIILLAKHASDFSSYNKYEKEWYLEFKKYIGSLTEDEQIRIEELKEKIELI